MNELNCGSREACQKLFEAGVVVETEASWTYRKEYGWRLSFTEKLKGNEKHYLEIIPALSMAEAWRIACHLD